MSICVQPVQLPDGDRTWTVLGDFLYRHPELRARIERLRGHQPDTRRKRAS